MKYSQLLKDNLNKDIEKSFPYVTKITKSMQKTRAGISRMVMLDRYSQKDSDLKTLAIGDLVVAKIKDDPMFPTLGIAYVHKITKMNVEIKVEDEYLGQIDQKLNPKKGIISINKNQISKPLEIYYEQIASRVSKALGKGESDENVAKFEKEISDLNIVPAGRVLYGAGSNSSVTYFNCFVMPMIQDSRQGLADHRKEVMEIMARGGGVGTNGSTLRPKNASAITVGGKSSGSVSWLNDLASLTDLVQQGGSRRGAQMIMMQDWHPDIIEFIVSKMQKPEMLRWISKNFKDPIIKSMADSKLKFNPLEMNELKMHKEIISLSKDEDLVAKSKKAVKLGGKYSVIFPNFLTGANISVGITKEFMNSIKSDGKYELRFPDIDAMTPGQKEYYDSNWHEIGDVRIWEEKGYPVKTYHTIDAKELWDLINFCATYSAEPGVFFIDRANEMTNATTYGQKVVCTNPCGEQPLAPYSVCNLAAINLANMIDKSTGKILWDKLKSSVRSSIRLQDNIIDATPYFLDANEKQAKGERRIGMGVMGLHDLLIWHGVRYGSPKSLKVIDKIFEVIATTAYIQSIELGEEKGSFGFFTGADKFIESGFMKKMPKAVIDKLKKTGKIRNSHLLTIAPTGSTGTMVGVSTGLEPYFAFKYFRSGRLGKFMEVDQAIVEEYRKIKNLPKDSKLPNFFVSANDLSPEEHADAQTTIQRWVDSSISKTVNAPKGYTVKQVEKIYSKLYKDGAKGGTVYVDGSRESQVLSISKNDVMDMSEELILEDNSKRELQTIQENHANIPNNKFNKSIGTQVGEICPICKEGTIEDLGGCNSCTNCGAQLKCGL